MSTDLAQPQNPPLVADPALPPPTMATTSRVRPIAWARQDTLIVLLAIACGLVLYLWHLAPSRIYLFNGDPASYADLSDRDARRYVRPYVYDELYHAYTAARLAQGSLDPYNPFAKVPPEDRLQNKVSYVWDHPAVGKLLMQIGIKLYGDTPFGWRVIDAIFGALGLGIIYALGRIMFDRTVALFATALLLLDGLWFGLSRIAMIDVFLVCFLMLAYIAFYLYLTQPEANRWRYLLLSGVGLGLALATKWSAIYSIGFLGLIATVWEARIVWRRLRLTPRQAIGAGLGAIGVLALTFVGLPIALYIGAYTQFFLRGGTFNLLGQILWQTWQFHTNLKACHPWSSPWWTWPLMLRPVWYYRFLMGNPLSWWLYLPAILAVGFLWIKRRDRSVALGLLLIGFLGNWLPWAMSPRVAYIYHMLPSVPFGVLALAYLLGQIRARRWIVGGYFALVALSFVFFYQLYTLEQNQPVATIPLARYTPLPNMTTTDLRYWLPTWRPGSAWAFGCPSPESTPFYWIQRAVNTIRK